MKYAAMISRAAFRLRSPTPTPTPTNDLLSPARLFYSSPPTASYTSYPGTPTPARETDGGSTVYRDSQKYARPSTVMWTERLHNSVSCTGYVKYPLRRTKTRNGSFGVHTALRIKTSDSDASFCVMLSMWNQLAQRALQHLKQDDYIYVSGQLGAYTTAALNGVKRITYKVTANELNYVKQGTPEVNQQRFVNLESEGQSSMEKHRNRLLMWQVLFANPTEWYDYRTTKKTPNQPDFRHKGTREALWLSDWDPPWVRKQLELLNCRPSGGGRRNYVPSEYLPFR